MAIDHSNCGSNSRRFCDDLFAALRAIVPTTVRHQTTTCGFTVGDSNRFAYLYHKNDAPLATIFLRGDDLSQIPPLSNGAIPMLREKLTGNWAKEFPLSIHLPDGSPPDETARMLVDYSLPLAARKRGTRAGREHLNGTELLDGKARTVLLTQHERNRALRARCIDHHGYACMGCGLLMREIYGKIADAFIHVHHLTPLADAGECVVDPINDLVPLCPNCHSVVHLKSPAMTIAELKRVLADTRRIMP